MNTQPRTLLNFAGVQQHPPKWDEAVLLLIDHQAEYVSGGVPLNGIQKAVDECGWLLLMARKLHAPVIHIVHHGRSGSALFDPDQDFVSIIPSLKPDTGEQVLVKSLPNGFARTDLDVRIKSTGRQALIIAGFATHMCVSSTTRAALDHGYTSTVVASACATRDLPSPSGGIVPAAIVHTAALAELADRFALVVPSPDVWCVN